MWESPARCGRLGRSVTLVPGELFSDLIAMANLCNNSSSSNSSSASSSSGVIMAGFVQILEKFGKYFANFQELEKSGK